MVSERQLNPADIGADEQAFRAERNLDEDQNLSSTSSSAFRAPVTERKPTRRLRRKRVSPSHPSGFPTPVSAFDSSKSQYARNRIDVPTRSHFAKGDGFSEADLRIASMTEHEVQDAVSEIHERFSPEIIEFLKRRSSTEMKDRKYDIEDQNPRPHQSSSNRSNILPTEVSDLVHSGVVVENEKLLWTMNPTSVDEFQLKLDNVLVECNRRLGCMGKCRFGFDGLQLSCEQVSNLPSHLGLHHHGAKPADAGYTISELILLSRSTVRGQRIIAFETLARVFKNNAPHVGKLLAEAGALSLMFMKLDEKQSSIDMATGIALLSAAEASLGGFEVTPVSELTHDSYFASYFYSPFAPKNMDPVLVSLLESDLVSILVQLARSCFTTSASDECARILNLIRFIICNCDLKHGCALLSKLNISYLLDIVFDRAITESTYLACDTLAQLVLFTGWGNPENSSVKAILLSDRCLRAVSSHLQMYLVPRSKLDCITLLTGAASTRVLRAALVFDAGTVPFFDSLSALTVLCNPNCGTEITDSIGCVMAECFRAMETYIHSLYSKLAHHHDTSNATDMRAESLRFLKQLELLVPFHQYANRIVALGSFRHRTQLKAAALHFVGSFTSMFRKAVSVDDPENVLHNVKEAIHAVIHEEFTAIELQDVLSFVHGAGRKLMKFSLPVSTVAQICKSLLSISRDKSEDLSLIRSVVANTATDWLVKLSRMAPDLNTARLAIDLIPHSEEPQFFMELLFKCIIHSKFLVSYSSDGCSSTAHQYVEKLSERTLQWLHNERSILEHKKTQSLTKLELVVRSWFESAQSTGGTDDVTEEGAAASEALISSNLISASSLYRVLPFASPSSFLKGSRFAKLVFLCGRKTFQKQLVAFDSYVSTKISAQSSERPNLLTNRLIVLCDALTDRGPFISDNSGIFDDTLATMVLNVMCRHDAHTSLRLHLWRSAVRDCGGGTLFNHAELFDESSFYKNNDEDDEVIAEYCFSIANGLMRRNRCPLHLRKIVFSRVSERLNCEDRRNALSPLFFDRNSFTNFWDFLQCVSTEYDCASLNNTR